MIAKGTNNILIRVIKYLLELNLWSNTTRHQAEDSCKNNIKLIDFVEQYAAARQIEGRKNYTGRSASQVTAFLNKCVKPVLEKNKDVLGETAELSV